MPQPPVNPSSGYPDPNAPSYPRSGQPGYQGSGEPSYGAYGQPAGPPPYGTYGQRETRQSNPASTPGPQKRSLGSWFSGLSAKNKFRVILLAVAVLVLPFAIYLGLDEPNQADVGDCMAGKRASDLRIVSCTDASAEWKVLGRLEGKTEADQDAGACNAHAGTTASFYQDGRRFRKGFILCLGPAKK